VIESEKHVPLSPSLISVSVIVKVELQSWREAESSAAR
jgi:hypothetical protein